MSTNSRPENVGILAMETYVPRSFVAQTDLEVVDGCVGKYTKGLGQEKLAFVDDREDVGSIMLTAGHNLIEKYGIDPQTIGRLEVGTETLVDKSKSIKTALMRLLGDNADIEGVTNVNACYGGTAALLNSVAWVESSDWDGRYALVVCGDIAVYEAGPARPTGGCAAFAMLIGPDAPLALETGTRSSHMMECYDFYKPNHSEYATVDGKLSQWAYLHSLDRCYTRYKQKYAKNHGTQAADLALQHFDYFALHSPYNKLVQKGVARLMYVDFKDQPTRSEFSGVSQDFLTMELEASYESRDLENTFRDLSNDVFTTKVLPSCRFSKNVGNSYTGSIFGGLLSLVNEVSEALVNKRVFMYSYGSGSAATVYSILGRATSNEFSIARIASTTGVFERLDQRIQRSVDEFTAAMDLRAAKYGQAPMIPDGAVADLFQGTYYLASIDDKHRRVYERTA